MYASREKLLFWTLMALLLAVVSVNQDFYHYTMIHWSYDYEYGFIKRGLGGAIYSWIHGNNSSFVEIYQLSFLVYLLASFLVYFYILSLKTVSIGTSFLFFASGFCVQQFGHDIGRHDQLIVILMIVSLWLVPVVTKSMFALAALVAITALVLMIHEAGIFFMVPTIFTYLLFMVLTNRCQIRVLVFYSVATVLVFLTLMALFVTPSLSENEFIAYLMSKIRDASDPNNLAYKIHYLSLQDNLDLTLNSFLSSRTLEGIILELLVFSPFLYIIFFTTNKIKEKVGIVANVVYLPIIGMLPMFVLGIDFFRWFAWMLLNFSLVVMCIAGVEGIYIDVSQKLKALLAIVVLYAGACGVLGPMPDRLFLVERVINIVRTVTCPELVPNEECTTLLPWESPKKPRPFHL